RAPLPLASSYTLPAMEPVGGGSDTTQSVRGEPAVALLAAVKKSWPREAVSCFGLELSPPGRMSRTRTVPAAVPSLRHSSHPEVPSVPTKYATPPALAIETVGSTPSAAPG